MTMNTTATMERTSTVLREKCERTQCNMKRLMAEAGCEAYEESETTIPLAPGSKDDVAFVGLNGVGFYFLRGKAAMMPEPLREILHNAGEL